MRKLAVLPTGDEYDREFEPLRGVERHQGDDPLIVIGDLIGVRHEGDTLEESLQAPGLRFSRLRLVGPAVHLLVGDPHRGVARELPRDGGELLEVVQPGRILRVVRFLQLREVAGARAHLGDELPEIRHPGLLIHRVRTHLAELGEQVHEPGDRVASPGTEHVDLTGRGIEQCTVETDAVGVRVQRDERLRPVAYPTPWGVDDPAEAHGVIGIVQHLEIGDDVPDLPTFVEPGAAHDAVGHAGADEHLLQCAGGVVRPVHHRDVGVPHAPVRQGIDLRGDEAGLVVLIVGHVADYRFAFTEGGPQLLLPPALVPGDDRVGRREDRLRRTVVLLEENGPRLRVIPLEFLDVPDRRPTESVD